MKSDWKFILFYRLGPTGYAFTSGRRQNYVYSLEENRTMDTVQKSTTASGTTGEDQAIPRLQSDVSADLDS
jgi:hypothetical protein